MIHRVDKPVGVITIHDIKNNVTKPWCIKWQERYYHVDKLTMLHPVQDGRTLIHIFSVCTKNGLYFRLEFNTRSLQWVLKEMDDGLPT